MKKVQLRNLSSYIAPVIAILTVFIIVVLLTWQVTESKIELSSMQTSSYFAASLDTQLTSIDSYSYDLLNLPQATALTAVGEEHAANEQVLSEANQLRHHLWAVINASDHFDNIIYYFPNLDKVVCRQGYLDTNQLFFLEDIALFGNPDGIRDRFNAVFGSPSNSYYTVYNPWSEQVECYYARSSPMNATAQNCEMILVIRINAASISTLLDEIAQDMGMSHIALVTEEGRIFAQSGQPDPDFMQMLANEDTSVSSGFSLWGMTLYFVHGQEDNQRFLKTVLLILIAGLVSATVLGVYLALRNHRRTASKIQNAKDQLGESDAISLEAAIANHLCSSQSRNQENMLKLQEQQVLVNYAFLRDLLGRGDGSDSALESLASIYNVELEYDCFSLFAINCKNKSTADMHHQPIMQYISAINPEDATLLWTDIDMVQFFLCCYNESESSKVSVMQLQSSLSDLLATRVYGNADVLSSIGAVIEEFRTLYQVIEGRRFMPYYRSIYEMQDIYCQLRDCLITSDQDKLALLLPQVQQQLQSESLTNSQKCQRYAFLADLYQAQELSTSTNTLDQMFQDLSAETWMNCLQTFLNNPAVAYLSQQEQRQVAAQVAQIIADEYANPQMSLAMLASRLGVSQSYLSRSFKQKYGENISHYLSRIRIEHAKSLIRNGDENLNAIALSVGFLSDMNLIRVFKRLENETPGNFRKKHKQE